MTGVPGQTGGSHSLPVAACHGEIPSSPRARKLICSANMRTRYGHHLKGTFHDGIVAAPIARTVRQSRSTHPLHTEVWGAW